MSNFIILCLFSFLLAQFCLPFELGKLNITCPRGRRFHRFMLFFLLQTLHRCASFWVKLPYFLLVFYTAFEVGCMAFVVTQCASSYAIACFITHFGEVILSTFLTSWVWLQHFLVGPSCWHLVHWGIPLILFCCFNSNITVCNSSDIKNCFIVFVRNEI